MSAELCKKKTLKTKNRDGDIDVYFEDPISA